MASLRLYCGLLLACFFFPTFSIVSVMAHDDGDALDKSLMFFEAQRSGILPSDQRVNWRTNSGLNDGLSQQVDLVGGYYDAGDHVKFGLPMTYSVTLMAWAALDFKNEIVAANQMDHTLEAIRWGTDYFIKAHSEDNVLWAQVGDGESDHCCWQRAEDMTTSRTAYSLDSSKPGSDLAGETAACLAAASLAFKTYNSSYSTLLLTHAKQLFSFADNFRGQYDDSIPNAESFYPSSGYLDELLWAAAWLYRATNNDYYLQYATNNAVDLGGTGNAVKMFSWDNKYAGLQILLSKFFLDGDGQSYTETLKQYKAKADYFACAYLKKNNGDNVAFTPGGLAFLLPSNNLQYVASASFILAVYSDYLSRANSVVDCPDEAGIQPQALLDFAKSQADYILGENPQSMSYLVGYGSKYPEKLHHRGSSIPCTSILPSPVGCVQGFESWYKNPNPNPNILNGALIGGPDSSDCFTDDRDNYEQTEPTTCAVAPLIGLFSKLQSVSSSTTSVSGYESLTNPPLNPTTQGLTPETPSVPPPTTASPPRKSQAPPSKNVTDASAPSPPPLPTTAPSPSSGKPEREVAPSPQVIVDYVLTDDPVSSSAPAANSGYASPYNSLVLLILVTPLLII